VAVDDFSKEGILFVVSHVEISYFHPVRYNDLIHIETRIIDAGGASFTFTHRIRLNETDRVVVEGTAKLVCVGPKGKPRRLPDKIQKIVGRNDPGGPN